ncbi:NmrA family NAD(P)-binding protein [Novosphingobium cyanobacteriorum]|uniref:NmrA family NAD(P)-binding protein n=1 Tax=Novosphingobium cyanobacteriorum TaxID=3024215 RepID=A0ABT6CP89_9SPHN|nr:NmrA family NAD(P)-binding protein [Novosphingobium cyanobacteriorum]MDF8335314.1 NmrA family NAD(P)-binding protein [Novosphingobium cyanobacteriorum]
MAASFKALLIAKSESQHDFPSNRMPTMTQAPILVTGGTGAQGGATINALLADGRKVRALVRDPASHGAQALAARGVELVVGDFDDEARLAAAMQGVDGVFSMQTPPSPTDLEAEVRAGGNLVNAALAAGVSTFVHTSVARAGDQADFVGWHEGRWWFDYWNSKSGVNDLVRAAGFDQWVILKPAYMMDNFVPPKVHWMAPSLERTGELVTAMAPDTRLDLVDAADVGRFAAAAFADPERFNRQEIDLAAESLTIAEIAEVISAATGKTVTTACVSPEVAIGRGCIPGLVLSEQWNDVEGYKVDLARAGSHGIVLTTFADFAARHAGDFRIGQK